MAFSDDADPRRRQDRRSRRPGGRRTYLADTLILRRDKIGRAYLTKINPIVDPVLDAIGRADVRQRGRPVRVRSSAHWLHCRVVALRQRHRCGHADWADHRQGPEPAGTRRPADDDRCVHPGGVECASARQHDVGAADQGPFPSHRDRLDAGRPRAPAADGARSRDAVIPHQARHRLLGTSTRSGRHRSRRLYRLARRLASSADDAGISRARCDGTPPAATANSH